MSSRAMKGRRRLALVFAAVIFAFVGSRFFLSAWHPVDAALLLQAFFSGGKTAWLGRWKAPPRRLPVASTEADLYLPGGAEKAHPRGCILLAHGMTDMGKADPRLVAFARNLARLDFAVVVPELPGMRRFRPEAGDAGRIMENFLWMDEKFSASGAKCGLFSFSFAAGPAMMAAARPAMRARVGYLIGMGAYYDLKTVLRHLTTGGLGEAPAFPGGPPTRVGKWLFLRYNMAMLELKSNEPEIEKIIRLKFADESADISALVRDLPSPLQNLILLIENNDPDRFDKLYKSQPARFRKLIDDWSMSRLVPKTRMPLFLLHGRPDPFVPFEESLRLAAAARGRGKGAGGAKVFIASVLGHADPGAGGLGWNRAFEALRLLGFVSTILTAMEGG
jgi:pimeloyl-ACP methyl ester carboxylesterase